MVSALCYNVIKANGSVESRTTVQDVTDDDYAKPENKLLFGKFDVELDKWLDDTNFHLKEGEEVYDDDSQLNKNDNQFAIFDQIILIIIMIT